MKSLITIVVPIYNIDEKYLRNCIESLVGQTLKSIEIILVNDGSTNNAQEICEEFAKKDKRIKIINQKNQGVSAARNKGIEEASSQYLMFVDGDDWITKECCEETYKHIGEFDLVIFSYNKIYSNGRKQKISIYNDEKIYKDNIKEFNYYDMRILGSSCMKLYSKKIIKDERFNEELKNGEDIEFNYRVFKNIKSVKFINKNYYNYNIRMDSSVRKCKEDMITSYTNTLNVMRRECEKEENRQSAYYSFCAISFLMICLNYIYSKSLDYKSRKLEVNMLKTSNVFSELFQNTDKLELPITRKLPIIFMKHNYYWAFDIIIKIKKKIQGC